MDRAIPIASLDDPRVAPYRNLKDRELARMGGRFIAEGELVARRLLTSGIAVESVLAVEKKVDAIAPLVPDGVPLYSAAPALVNQVLGFPFHTGVIACGFRSPSPTIDQLAAGWAGRVTLCICPEVINTDNLGSLIRISAALGVAGMVLGERSCDPFYRQSIRVSMGTVFNLPIVRSQCLLDDLAALRTRYGFELAATVLDEAAESLARAGRGERLGVLLGSESQGLSSEQVAACTRRITIPMSLGTDSLNVSVAAGIVLHHFTQVA